jgi:aromatic ring hydroxylase
MAVFEDVLVPWERVFIHRDPEMCHEDAFPRVRLSARSRFS